MDRSITFTNDIIKKVVEKTNLPEKTVKLFYEFAIKSYKEAAKYSDFCTIRFFNFVTFYLNREDLLKYMRRAKGDINTLEPMQRRLDKINEHLHKIKYAYFGVKHSYHFKYPFIKRELRDYKLDYVIEFQNKFADEIQDT